MTYDHRAWATAILMLSLLIGLQKNTPATANETTSYELTTYSIRNESQQVGEPWSPDMHPDAIAYKDSFDSNRFAGPVRPLR